MFEFDKFRGPPSGTRPAQVYTPLPAPARRSFLLWGEHCIECAAPDCFSSCDLYDPRPDSRCRRFEGGIYRNPAFASASGAGAEVRFRRWGKIEARGNAVMLPDAEVRRMEALAARAIPLADAAGKVGSKLTGDIRGNYLGFALSERYNRRLAKRRDPAILPDAFVVEVYNPGEVTVEATLAMAIDRGQLGRALTAEQLPPALFRRLSFAPGYSLERIPRAAFRAIVESDLPFNIALTPQPDGGAHLVFLTLDFVAGDAGAEATATAADVARPAAKCVVFDLDNTLWDGILVEGEVRLRPGIAELFAALDRRGILISVASKNAHDEALARLTALGIEDYVLFPHINWGPKSESLRGIAKAIDIGLDTLVFVDDNPFERAEVARSLPEIEVLPDSSIPTLLDHPRLQGSSTPEAATRRLMYRESMQRAAAEVAFGDDYLSFLRDCGIRVELRPDRPEDFDRIAELVQRTNQLNFSGRKYGRDDIAAILADPGVERYVLTVDDKFGSYGTVGFCLAVREGAQVTVRDFMLSCRVQGKFVEQALFHHLCARPDWQAEAIAVTFVRTPRNRLAEAVLDKLGFPPGEGVRQRAVTPETFAVDFLTVDGRWA